MTDGYKSIKEKFAIETLDVKSRDFAGIYATGKIYCAATHVAAIEQYRKDNLHLTNRITFLHFLKREEKLIAFIDLIALFQKIPIAEVAGAVIDQMPEVERIYKYKYPDEITLVGL